MSSRTQKSTRQVFRKFYSPPFPGRGGVKFKEQTSVWLILRRVLFIIIKLALASAARLFLYVLTICIISSSLEPNQTVIDLYVHFSISLLRMISWSSSSLGNGGLCEYATPLIFWFCLCLIKLQPFIDSLEVSRDCRCPLGEDDLIVLCSCDLPLLSLRSFTVLATHLAPCRYPRSAGPLSEHLAALALTLYPFPVGWVEVCCLHIWIGSSSLFIFFSYGPSSELLLGYNV